MFGENKNCKELIELGFDSYEWLDQTLPTGISGSYSYKKNIDEEYFFVIKGEVKNISANTLDLSRVLMKFEFNSIYNYYRSFATERKDTSSLIDGKIEP